MWTPEYFVRYLSFPSTVEGVTIPNDDGTFDIYINATLCEKRQRNKLEHELRHIVQNHFYQECQVALLEQQANGIAIPKTNRRLPNVFEEAGEGRIPFFKSLEAFRDYMFSMRDQVQRDKRKAE